MASRVEFVNRLEAFSTEIASNILALVAAAKVVDNEHADRQGVELKVTAEAVRLGVVVRCARLTSSVPSSWWVACSNCSS